MAPHNERRGPVDRGLVMGTSDEICIPDIEVQSIWRFNVRYQMIYGELRQKKSVQPEVGMKAYNKRDRNVDGRDDI